ncbi:MAG: YdeI/OmpD-associated family protein [Cytophaga sp.]|uniref:YdeI/OmpD-associated family protein n=1 Tax=Cytophaga sp. TaxID=29535 RepID=UPI003F7D0770
MNPKVDFYFTKAKTWQEEIELLREIVLDCDLNEVLKWGCPCYTFEDSNIVLIHTFKEYCALLFFKGALMKAPKDILIQQTANVQAARQMRFTSAKEITKLKTSIKAYIKEAIAIEKAGLKVELKKTSEFEMPEEFKQVLKEDAALKKAFKTLTPGRQRAYLLHFSSAKQSKTREARIEKCIPDILEGKGLND